MLSENELKEFSRKIDNFNNQIENVKNGCTQIEKDSKKLLDTFNKSLECEKVILSKMEETNNGQKDKRVKWSDSLMEKQKAMNQSIKVVNEVLVNPGKRLQDLFPNVVLLNKKREQLHMDLLSLESKLQKYEQKERTAPNILKINEFKQEYKKVASNYILISNTLIDDGEMISNSNYSFFSSALKSLMQSNLDLCESLHNESLQISDLFTKSDNSLKAFELTTESQLNDKLINIRSELSIVRSDDSTNED